MKAELKDKVLFRILGNQYGTLLERGELKLRYAAGAFFVQYYQSALPVAPRNTAQVLGHRLPELLKRLGNQHPPTP